MARTEYQLRNGDTLSPLGPPVADLFKEYARRVSRYKRGERWEVFRMESWMGSDLAQLSVGEVSSADIAKWRDDRRLQVSDATVRREMSLVGHVFSKAKEWGYREDNPTLGVKKPKDHQPRTRRIAQAEIDKLCEVAGFDGLAANTLAQRVAVAMLFSVETAMRAGEVCLLKSDLIDGRVARLPKTKNGYARDVPLSSRALELLALVESDFRLTSAQVDATFRRLKAKAKLTDLHYHDTRREALSRLSQKLTALQLAKMSGHRDLKILLNVYYQESAEDVADLLD